MNNTIDFNKSYVLSAECVITKGVCRSILCDLRFGIYHFIPNGMYQILYDHTIENIGDTLEKYSAQDKENKQVIE